MINPPPPEPRSSRKGILSLDEFIGILVAFGVIGTILFWAIAKKDGNFQLTNLPFLFPKASTQPTLTPIPVPKASANVAPPAPTSVSTPTGSPELSPVTPSPTSQLQAGIPRPVVTPNHVKKPAKLPATTAAIVAKPTSFIDVQENFWAHPYITALQARGIMTGFPDSHFRPNQPVTRAEFAGIVQRAFANKTIRPAKQFKDIPSKYWATPTINGAYQVGFLNGYPDNTFQPKLQISRSQVLISLVTGLGLNTEPNPAKVLQVYNDAQQIPNYAKDEIASATKAGLVVNYPDPNLLKPNQFANRAEVAALVYQALVKAGKAEPIQSQYIVQPPS